MKILALEFSSSIRTAAVYSSDGLGDSGTVLGYATDLGKRSETALRLIEQAIGEAGVDRKVVDLLAVGLGPGSYTGIRSAIAIAQGWHLGRPTAFVGIGTADCLAAQAQALGWFGSVGIVIDAQRGDYYFATYQVTRERRVTVRSLEIVCPGQSTEADSSRIIYVGPAAPKFFKEGRTLQPDARVLAELAAQSANSMDVDTLVPIYLRETSFVKAPPARRVPSA